MIQARIAKMKVKGKKREGEEEREHELVEDGAPLLNELVRKRQRGQHVPLGDWARGGSRQALETPFWNVLSLRKAVGMCCF